VGVRASLCTPRLISRALKASCGHYMNNHKARTWDHRGSKPLGLKLLLLGHHLDGFFFNITWPGIKILLSLDKMHFEWMELAIDHLILLQAWITCTYTLHYWPTLLSLRFYCIGVELNIFNSIGSYEGWEKKTKKPKKPKKKKLKKPNREKSQLVRFRFYKPKIKKTEPNRTQTGKKPSQTGLNRFWFFFKKILVWLLSFIKTEPNRKWLPLDLIDLKKKKH
jgi:hypothetical protein